MTRLAPFHAAIALAIACVVAACGDNIEPSDPTDPLCGDGVVAASEACDDGDTADGDGCSATCTVSPGYTCSGAPSVCVTACGDGMISGTEQCDDGDAEAGDGCSAACAREPGWVCSGAPSTCVASCGDGVVTGAEACDDGDLDAGDGCDASCVVEDGYTCTGAPSACATTCGDGTMTGAEACDDGNTVELDGCSNECRVDTAAEVEPNDTIDTAGGPYGHDVLVTGAIDPAADVDLYEITVATVSDLEIETTDDLGLGSCRNIDTELTLLDDDGATVIASDNDGGTGLCSRIGPDSTPAVRRLAPGTYYAAVRSFGGVRRIPAYGLVIRFPAVCGNGATEGSEECDGGDGCAATCERIARCGDGLVDAPEACDDGDVDPGDGCDASCAYETLPEAEPNDTTATASGPFVPNVLIGGAIASTTDVDVFAITLPATADLRIETLGADGAQPCAADTEITLWAPDGTTELARRRNTGVGLCDVIDSTRNSDAAARHLAAGTYYLEVAAFAPTTPGYTLLVTFNARCGDGAIGGGEECDGGTGCTDTCDRIPVCGDRNVDAPETCDDGNTTAGDGCDASCGLEATDESEPNNVFGEADVFPAADPTAVVTGSITPTVMGVFDVDFYTFTLAATADITLATSSATLGSCGINSRLRLFGSDGVTLITENDDASGSTCAAITARGLAAGTYFVALDDSGNNDPIAVYRLSLTIDALCGDGAAEGSEECDGGAACDATCQRVPTCGDGFTDAPETCDDGGTQPGDGCDAACAIEAIAEVEPNGTPAEADAGAAITGRAVVRGAIDPVGDVDLVRLDLAADSLVHLSTSDGPATCAITTTLRIRDAGGTEIYVDDEAAGLDFCSAITAYLAAGTYYVQVEDSGNDGVIAGYLLAVDIVTATANEVEPNDRTATATAVAGADVYVLGSHQDVLDTDLFAITVPAGGAIRAEIIEGGDERCESEDIDSVIVLYDPAGVFLETDDDGGRGYCSLLDGIGNSSHGAAANLPAGTYYLGVEASLPAQTPDNTTGQFDYRLVVVVR
jgi:cysteine-rich repeat protein